MDKAGTEEYNIFSNRMCGKVRGQGMDGIAWMAWKEIQMHVLHRGRRTKRPANGVRRECAEG